MANSSRKFTVMVTNVARYNLIGFCKHVKVPDYNAGVMRREVVDCLLGKWDPDDWGEEYTVPDKPLWEKQLEEFALTKSEWGKVAKSCKDAVDSGQYPGTAADTFIDLCELAEEAPKAKELKAVENNGK